jgi:hypothetical protein
MSTARESGGLEELIPQAWISGPNEGKLRIVLYQAEQISPPALLPGRGIVDLEDLRIVLFRGRISLPEGIREVEFSSEGTIRYEIGSIEPVKTEEAWWLLMLMPTTIDGSPVPAVDLERRVTSASGLVGAINGRTVVWKHNRSVDMQFPDGKVASWLPVPVPSFAYPAPRVKPEGLVGLQDVVARLGNLALPVRNRVLLSLSWYDEALRRIHVDGFLRAWVAIEVLAMPDGTSIAPINDRLGEVYGISSTEAARRFATGRLFGMRGRILHAGATPQIHFLLLLYVQALCVDVLLHVLQAPPQYRVAEVEGMRHFNLPWFLSL